MEIGNHLLALQPIKERFQASQRARQMLRLHCATPILMEDSGYNKPNQSMITDRGYFLFYQTLML